MLTRCTKAHSSSGLVV